MQTEEDSVEVITERLHPLSHSVNVQMMAVVGSADCQTPVLRVEPGARLGSVDNPFLDLLFLLLVLVLIHLVIVVVFFQ